MALTKSIRFNGINRALPQSDQKDGMCNEIINMRFRKGCWRPMGYKQYHKSFSLPTYDKIELHDIENGINPGEPNWIGYKKTDGTLFLIYATDEAPTVLIETAITRTATPGEDVNIVFLKRTMIVTSESNGVEVFLWADGAYSKTSQLPVPNIVIAKTSGLAKGVQADEQTTSAGIIGKFYENVNELSESEGYLYGSIMYMAAYRLFDGSYIIPSMPKYVEIYNGGNLRFRNPGGGHTDDRTFWLEFYGYKINATLNKSDYPSEISNMKDLIDSVCIFATKVTPLYAIEERLLTDKQLAEVYGTYSNSQNGIDTWPFSTVFKEINRDFKELAKSSSWYKIHEINFEDIVGGSGLMSEDIDMTGFYQDYATRETLTTDQFSHHLMSAREAFVYNDRLHLANIRTIPGNPYVLWQTTAISTTYQGTIVVWLKTSSGKAVINSFDTEIPEYSGSFLIPGVLGYNDARAYKMQIFVTISGTSYLLFSESLEKNTLMNYAYWFNPFFTLSNSDGTNYKNKTVTVASVIANSVTSLPPTQVDLPFDPNRLQVSEIQNPIVFPTKNSYQIGTGEILKIMAGSEPLSTGQFGQFPLQVFTSKGIWALEIGTGDVLYLNVLPVNGEVINNRNNVVPLSLGVCYTTTNGLYVVNGRQVIELAENMENTFDTFALPLYDEIQTLITDPMFCQTLVNSLSDTDFLSYLMDSIIGYDHINKELIVTSDTYNYSYIYSFENQIWYKYFQSYRLLINSYPKLLGVNSVNIVSISEETYVNPIDCLIISSAQHLENPEAFKKIERAILRVKMNVADDCRAGFYLFGSDDLQTWQLMSGNQRGGSSVIDLKVQRTHVTTKYFAFVFAGRIYSSAELKNLELIFNVKWNNRLR